MAGLLDFLNTDEGRLGLGLLSAGGYSPTPMSAGQRIQSAFQGQDAYKQNQMRGRLLQSQIDENDAQTAIRKATVEAQMRKRDALPGLFGQGMSPGAASPDGMGQGAAPQGLNWQAALAAGYTPDEIMKLAGLPNAGRAKVARSVKGIGPDGREFEYQVDEFGQRVGDGLAQYRAPLSINQGNRTTFADPYSLKPVGEFKTFQGPDSAATLAETRRHNGVTEANSAATLALGKAPAGYRPNATGGLEFIPGGPADPNAAKRAAPTEFQGKSATYGARALEADKIISSLDGKYSPMAVNSKMRAGAIPLIGGALEAGGNALLTDSGQKAEQAQRDFINAVLRQESGAAISQGEFENARKQYFAQPLDGAAVKAQKAKNRQTAIQGFLNNARPGAVDSVANKGGASDDNDPLGLRK